MALPRSSAWCCLAGAPRCIRDGKAEETNTISQLGNLKSTTKCQNIKPLI